MSKTPRRVQVARAVLDQMENSKLTQSELAAETGIPADILGARLSGSEPFDVDQLESISFALNVDMVSLLGPG